MKKSVVVIGSGGREHALAVRLAACAGVERVVVAPGNTGTYGARIESASGAAKDVVRAVRPDLVVVGPEAPLAEGLVDELQREGFLVYGPSRSAAQLETSKAFMKAFANRHGIRTAEHVTLDASAADFDAQLTAGLRRFSSPPVVKASGLCAGKGVVVAESYAEAEGAAREMLSGAAFGEAGRVVVLEERLLGEEASIHAICDGNVGFVLPAIQDHKRIGEGDQGANTGGMGTYGPAPVVTPALQAQIAGDIVQRTLDGMRAEGNPFIGTLFAGVMVSPAGEPVLLEINTRFGDPETQVLMGLIDGDFYGLLESAARGRLEASRVSVNQRHGLCVVIAAPGYPAAPRTGSPILGLERAAAHAQVYHAGTRRVGEAVVSAGGRVLGVTAFGDTLTAARDRAYAACAEISFEGMQLRRDIGHRALPKGA